MLERYFAHRATVTEVFGKVWTASPLPNTRNAEHVLAVHQESKRTVTCPNTLSANIAVGVSGGHFRMLEPAFFSVFTSAF